MIDAVNATLNDVRTGLSDVFEINEDTLMVEPEYRDQLMHNERFVAVPWSVTATHIGTFVELERTGRTVVIEGVTIVKVPPTDDGTPEFQRYIDWSAVFGQLGVALTGRPILATEQA
jgi:hypothetical protein